MSWIGILIVLAIVIMLLLLVFRNKLRCPQCGSKNLKNDYNSNWDYTCIDCGREFNKDF